MTLGYWVCIECGHRATIPIYHEISECPKCEVEYELVKRIQPHICHTVPIMKSTKSGKLVTNRFIAFATGTKQDDIQEYFKALAEMDGVKDE
jgi:hypothetical protein